MWRHNPVSFYASSVEPFGMLKNSGNHPGFFYFLLFFFVKKDHLYHNIQSISLWCTECVIVEYPPCFDFLQGISEFRVKQFHLAPILVQGQKITIVLLSRGVWLRRNSVITLAVTPPREGQLSAQRCISARTARAPAARHVAGLLSPSQPRKILSRCSFSNPKSSESRARQQKLGHRPAFCLW